MPMYVAKIGFCRTYQSMTPFPRASTCATVNGQAMAQQGLALSSDPSRWDAATALVPTKIAEVLGPCELFPREDRSVDAHEFVVERAGIADPDSAFHVTFEARLNRHGPLSGQVPDRLHHLLGPARADLLEPVARAESVRQSPDEAVEPAGAAVRPHVDPPSRAPTF